MAYPATVPLEAVSRRCLSNLVDYLWELEFLEPPPTEAEWEEMLAMLPPCKVGVWDWDDQHRSKMKEVQQAEHEAREAREREKARRRKRRRAGKKETRKKENGKLAEINDNDARGRHDCERRAGKKENGKQKMGHRRK